MNAPLNPDPTLYTSSHTVGVSGTSGYSPSVPISVYRELAAELKTTQATVDALTKQNQQLVRQNKLLRQEIQRFVQAAEQLGHFAGVAPQSPTPMTSEAKLSRATPAPSDPQLATPELAAPLATVTSPETRVLTSEVVAPSSKQERGSAASDRPRPSTQEPIKQHLFIEQPEGIRPLSKVSSRPDLGNLWLATTILLVILTAFGAGFLIMRPLLNR